MRSTVLGLARLGFIFARALHALPCSSGEGQALGSISPAKASQEGVKYFFKAVLIKERLQC